MKIVSWNVAGIRACTKKGLTDFIKKENADVYCFQEVKCSENQIPIEISSIKEYFAYHSISKKKGYSGVSIYTKIKPIKHIEGIGQSKYDDEGRVLTLEFPKFFLINAYFPHANRELTRLNFKLEFNNKFLQFCKELEKRKSIIIASDFNVAHTSLDLANPKQNEKNAGFTIQERNWFDLFLQQGFTDTFRIFVKEGGQYTWWAYRNNARERNIGWRIDYFVVSSSIKIQIENSKILNNVLGSDHCPILLEISSF